MAMTCEYEFIQNGWVEPLDDYVNDSSIADPNLDLDDFYSLSNRGYAGRW